MHIFTANEMYELDRIAMEKGGIDGRILMENAGRAITEKIIPLIARDQQILVLVGAGNNGGDGFVIARTLSNLGYHVRVVQVVPDMKIQGDAAYHKQVFINLGGYVHVDNQAEKMEMYVSWADVIIDAILGIGMKGKVRPPLDRVINIINNSNALKISVDIPSGIPADEGHLVHAGIRADYTFVIEQPKMSSFLQHTANFYGKWEVVSIGLPMDLFTEKTNRCTWGEEEVRKALPKRDSFSHKGSHGRALVIGGCSEMPGSVTMTALAALRSGIGLLTVGSVNEVISSVAANCVEATFLHLTSEEGKISGIPSVDFSNYNAIAIGMGMGRERKTGEVIKHMMEEAKVPIIMDADALYHIHRELTLLKERRHPTILTPHPGEMALLTGIPVEKILAEPFAVSKAFAEKYRVYLILKGPFTIVTNPDGEQWVNTSGNAGLAKGGSGDVLSGILLAMIMKPQTMTTALTNGCYIHGKSADVLIENRHSEEDLLATDVIKGLASVFRTFL